MYLSKPENARFALDTYTYLRDLISENSIPCDWRSLLGIHSIYSPTVLSLVRTRITQLQKHHPDLASKVHLITDKNELKKLRLRDNAIGAVVQDYAASLWPYKLICWVLEDLLEGQYEGKLNLQTNTPVMHLQRHEDDWTIHTDRGQISSPNVILATNGYTSYLLPKFTNVITPVRGQIAALVPPQDSRPLEGTHVWSYKAKGDAGESDDYLVQAPTGHLIFGGERLAVPSGGEGVSNDTEVDPIVSQRLHNVLSSTLRLSDSDPDTLKSEYEWTGIMGFSADGQPWVGAVPEELGGGKGLWISAGYTGNGMPVAARTGIAVAERILGKTGVVVPVEWEVSGGRVERIKGLEMAEGVEGELRALVDGDKDIE